MTEIALEGYREFSDGEDGVGAKIGVARREPIHKRSHADGVVVVRRVNKRVVREDVLEDPLDAAEPVPVERQAAWIEPV